MQPHDHLTIRAASLAKSSPQLWRDFLQALAEYSNKQRENLLSSPLPDLPVNQGRAQAINTLHRLLTDAPDNAGKINGANK